MIILCSKSQPFNQGISARGLGMGDATVASCDHWSVFNNVGGFSKVKSVVSLLSIYNRFDISELNSLSAGLVYPAGAFNLGLTINRFGGRVHHQNQVGLAFGHTLGNTSLGIKVNYLVFNTEGYGSRGYPIVEVGSVTELSPQLSLGMYAYNVNLAKFDDPVNNRLPVSFRAGISYQPVPSFVLNAEVDKTLKHITATKIGVLYQLKKKFYISSGIRTNPFNYTFGIGMDAGKIGIDYAITGHSELGLSHLLSISYKLKPENEAL